MDGKTVTSSDDGLPKLWYDDTKSLIDSAIDLFYLRREWSIMGIHANWTSNYLSHWISDSLIDSLLFFLFFF